MGEHAVDSVLIAINNWWVGGRETYVSTMLDELKWRATLIASLVQKDAPGLDRFERVEECGAGPYGQRWQSWLARDVKAPVLWAHHYELLPAWLLSRLHGIPMLTTFHGPLIGDARGNDLMQALGMTLALHRGDGVSGVSEECLDGLRALAPEVTPHLLPNAVAFPAAPPAPPTLPPRRFVMITRRGKLEHIRQAALLFAAYARQVRGCRLVVADGETNMPEKHAGTMRAAMRQLGARWALQQGAGFLRSVPKIDFIGWTADSQRHIREADAVLGMGRVVLEGMAEGRIAVLVGYNAVHGVVTPERFETMRRTNFSGRGLARRTHEEVAQELLAASAHPAPESISARHWAPRFAEVLRETASRTVHDLELAQRMADAIRGGAGAETIFRIAVEALTPRELETLYRVAEG